MNTQHTPGPWIVAEQAFEKDGGVCVNAPGHRSIAITTGRAYYGDGEPMYEENKANARLIAAAPELLAALQSITLAYDDLLVAYGNPHGWGTMESDNARAAIAKATGA